MKNKKEERLGEINKNNYGREMKIIKYNNNLDIEVEFDNGYKTKCEYRSFKKGSVRNPYDRTVYNKGFLGEGKYITSINKKQTKIYDVWKAMLQRAYSKKFKKNNPTYEDCIVCEEWHNFQKFGKWYDKNYYEVPGDKMQIDKDILYKENKLYSPKTCVFVPEKINYLFIKTDAKRGKLPIGVHYHRRNKKYCVQLKDENCIRKYIGQFDSPRKAFEAYKQEKELVIKKVAEKYKTQIPLKLYEAMLNYKVELND
ncbi:MAG: AP2 domain-containing protein [Halanaerobiales bacterium]